MFVVGVDSGGSKTRALAVGIDGAFAGYAESGGGHPAHNEPFRENVRAAIQGACSPFDIREVKAVVAGIAGLDRPEDQKWASEATHVPGLDGVRLQVNDAEIALFGAIEGRPGIVSIQGNGSMVMGKTESGRIVRNFDLMHYASAHGPRTGFRATYAVLSGATQPGEEDLIRQVLAHWGVSTVTELRELGMTTWRAHQAETIGQAGRLAPWVTEAAERGLPTAIRACELGAAEIVEGIRLLGPFFEADEVEVCLWGSCGRSPAISARVAQGLSEAREKRYRIVEPRFTALQGAVLWALRLAGADLTEELKACVLACGERTSPDPGQAR